MQTRSLRSCSGKTVVLSHQVGSSHSISRTFTLFIIYNYNFLNGRQAVGYGGQFQEKNGMLGHAMGIHSSK
jgi:hypothetical protein